MTTLSGRAPKDSFNELLKLNTSNNQGISTTLVAVTDGAGATTPLSLSSTTVAFYGKTFPSAPSTAGLVLTIATDGTLEWAASGSSITSLPYDVAGAVVGQATASANALMFVSPRIFTIPVGMENSVARVVTTATGTVVLSVRKNDIEFGTITFSAGVSTGVFASTAGATFASGDVLSVVTPAQVDATFANANFTIAATTPL